MFTEKILQQWRIVAKTVTTKTTENVLYVNLAAEPTTAVVATTIAAVEPGAVPVVAPALAEIKLDQLRELFAEAMDIAITKSKHRHWYVLARTDESVSALVVVIIGLLYKLLFMMVSLHIIYLPRLW